MCNRLLRRVLVFGTNKGRTMNKQIVKTQTVAITTLRLFRIYLTTWLNFRRRLPTERQMLFRRLSLGRWRSFVNVEPIVSTSAKLVPVKVNGLSMKRLFGQTSRTEEAVLTRSGTTTKQHTSYQTVSCENVHWNRCQVVNSWHITRWEFPKSESNCLGSTSTLPLKLDAKYL